jgi:hypothetical protein
MQTEVELLTYSPSSSPVLTPDEVDAAVKAGGAIGIVKAITARIPDIDVATRETIRRFAEQGELVKRANQCVTQFRHGQGGADHGDVLKSLDDFALATSVAAEACESVARWCASHPGELVHSNHSSGRRRVFD